MESIEMQDGGESLRMHEERSLWLDASQAIVVCSSRWCMRPQISAVLRRKTEWSMGGCLDCGCTLTMRRGAKLQMAEMAQIANKLTVMRLFCSLIVFAPFAILSVACSLLSRCRGPQQSCCSIICAAPLISFGRATRGCLLLASFTGVPAFPHFPMTSVNHDAS
ncbi:hypothetical protein K469DRAFT_302531 [Zopfia rhizophila CBS 207.26]|uniref:Uncharacterized protein n=1 Tax=Zopfia rhizophila CBS 207.26 TaxID=1314779 RepID=A0A6A6DIP4_9PEZI|nr:hypothetical protein K469DRAFT_302531 [Zopfia rhizophila CBS 207.26]